MGGRSSNEQTVGYKYYLGMHMILCHGPIDYITRIEVDSKDAFSGKLSGGQVSINKPELFGGEKREGGVVGDIDIEMGLPTQTKNDYLQARLGSSIPAFRTVVGVVLRQVYLGVNPYLKRWSFRAQRVFLRQNNIDQWYSDKAAIRPSYSGTKVTDKLIADYEDDWKYIVLNDYTTADYSAVDYDDSGWIESQGPFGSYARDNTFVPTGLAGRAIWLRRKITLEGDPTSLKIQTYNDDGVSIWWNGVLKVSGATGGAYTLNLTPAEILGGNNILAIRVVDTVPSGTATNIEAGARVTWSGTEYPHADMNPAHIIRECLTDPDWGMGYQDSDIDDTSFMSSADILHTERMGISLLWDRQNTIEAFVQEIVKHIDGSLYIDRVTGKFVLKLMRDDYDEGLILELDESNIVRIENLRRASFGELTNSVTVNYWDFETGETSSLTVQDTALAQMQGVVINTTIQYPGFTNSKLAAKIAARDLKALSSPLWTATIYANKTAEELNIGDVFKLSWRDYSLNSIVMRVTGLSFGNGKSNKVKIIATQDVFYLPENSVISTPEIEDGWQPIDNEVSPLANRIVQEAPYYELVQLLGQVSTDSDLDANPDLGYILCAGGRPSTEGAINALVYVDSGSGIYEDSDTLDFSPHALLDEDISETQKTFAITSVEDFDLIEVGTHCQLGTELLRVDSISLSSITVGRGVLDTLPVKHSQGDVLIFWDNYPATDEVEYSASESINVKLLPTSGNGILDEATTPIDVVTMDSRAIRPYPPGNLKVNTEYFPETISGSSSLSLTWAHRNRLQQTSGELYDFEDASIGPEASTTYEIDIYDELDVLGKQETALTGTSFYYSTANEADEMGQVYGEEVIPGDSDFASVVSLLHMDGSNGSATFTDEIGNTVTTGGAGVITTSEFKFGGASGDFTGSGAGVRVPFTGTIGSSDFTIEFWLKPTTLISWGTGFSIGVWNTSGCLHLIIGSGGTVKLNRSGSDSGNISSGMTTGNWYHIAVSRASGTIRLFIDGVQKWSASDSVNYSSGDDLKFALAGGIVGHQNGYYDDSRLTIGVGRYTSDFTPPDAAFPNSASASSFGSDRINGKLRFVLKSKRDGYESFQVYNHTVKRVGYGFNYGEYYGGV